MNEQHTCPECGHEFEAEADKLTGSVECPSCGETFNATPSDPEPDDSMDGDFDSGMASAGLGTDEDYGPGASEIE